MNPLASIRPWYSKRLPHKAATLARDLRSRLTVQALEDRATPAVISIADAAAIEGSAKFQFIDDFVDAGSAGAANTNVTFGPDGYFYAASGLTDQVLRYDANTGAFVDAVLTSGNAGIVLDNPWALAFGPDNKLYVGGQASMNVVRYDPVTGAVDEFIPAGSGVWSPKGLAFGPDGNLYVSNADVGTADTSTLQDQVVRFQGPAGPAPGQFLSGFVARGDHGLDNPNGLAFSGGSLYVANTRGDSVFRYDAGTGAFQGVFVAPNSGGLDVASAIAFDSGYLYVTSQGTAQVLRYDAATGAFVDAVATPGNGATDSTGGIDFDANGNLYVAFRHGTSVTPTLSDTYEVLRYGPASQAAFKISLSSASAEPVTVSYATASGGGASSDDYVSASGTVTFAPGETSRTVLVATLDDRVFEPSETFFVNLSDPVGATIADGQGIGTILDNEPRISIGDVTQAEGKKGKTTQFIFTVSLSNAYDQPVSVSFRTLNGTATTSNNDYVARTGTLTFAPGETTKTIVIDVKGDNTKESNETFWVELFGNSSNSMFLDALGLGTILNDD